MPWNIPQAEVVNDVGSPLQVNNVGKVTYSGVASATLTSVAASVTSVTLLASNANRNGATLVNDSLYQSYVAFTTTAGNSSYSYPLQSQAVMELPAPIYTGAISAIWVTASGYMRCTEY